MRLLVLLNSGYNYSEAEEYIRLISDFRNPVYISFVILLALMLFFYLMYKYVLVPRERKYSSEKKQLEMQNIRLMALFADLDPDPVFRVSLSGEIIFMNPAAANNGFEELIGRNIKDVLPSMELNFNTLIRDNSTFAGYEFLRGKEYAIQVSGISYLSIAQVYLHDVTELKIHQKALEDSQSELREFSRQLQNRIEDERQRISRELHDGAGQSLILLRLTLQRLFSKLTAVEAVQEFAESEKILEHVIKDLKNISYSLKPRVLEDMGLVPALIALTENIKKQSAIEGSIDFSDMEYRLNSGLETAIYRIVQEALTNIVKYSCAKEFNIQVVRKNMSLKIIISDDGKGFDPDSPANKKGMGLKNMKERTESHGGHFRINSSSEEGTIIVANFPLEDKEN